LRSFLNRARVYVAACADRRIERLPVQLEILGLPYVLEKELPAPVQRPRDARGDYVFWDRCSQRFREQMEIETDRPLLWLEDDIVLPEDFHAVWNCYELSLPLDWQIAILGYLTIRGKYTRIRVVNNYWWELVDGSGYPDVAPRFGGTQAVLFNSGRWRSALSGKIFQADWGMGRVVKDLRIRMYFANKRIIGTSDNKSTTTGRRAITAECMSVPIRFDGTNCLELTERDFAL
jgi:hypothetical protein